MRGLPRPVGDVLLAVLAVAVLAGAGYAVKQGGRSPAGAASLTVQPAAVTSRTPATAVPSPRASSPSPVRSVGSVVLAGPDLAQLKAELSTATGYAVQTIASATPEVLAPGALDAVTVSPTAVVLQVVAGSGTSLRTSVAIAAVKKAFPDTHILVVGPFSSADRKSSGAVKAASVAARVTFLDPVDLGWRAKATAATLSPGDVHSVAVGLAKSLS